MRVLHIATSFSGGAGIAARRICESQNQNGIESIILGRHIVQDVNHNSHEINHITSSTKKLASSFVTGLQQKIFQQDSRLLTPISISSLSTEDKIFAGFDLVHVHAFYNMLSIRRITEIAERIPIVLTMHDQRFFTGGCHYSFECLGYATSCQECPQVRSKFKFIPELSLQNSLSLLKNRLNITFMAPSQWLAKCANQSSLLQGNHIDVIPNPVPNTYKKLPAYEQRGTVFKVGFFSQNLNNPYKGIETLILAAQIVTKVLPIEIKFFGQGKIRQSLAGINYSQSYFSDDNSAVQAYNSCDAVVVPSTQDNLPSVISEALMCGIPVIGTKVGGIYEILERFSLPTIEPDNPYLLAQALLDIASKVPNYELRDDAIKIFSYKSSSEKHLQIYKRALVDFKPKSVE
jgi:glycosyltransferase involved in cell wall biosynthesis